ncbi:uncharacterized protein NECHADRAFT_85227 [Fusarium vanettenii 77-13-4]|uniref:Uncharacterized protein n=1 Tax=Fusarium vanettenii (strain ATCC MYA-4622 / CBS 123669 / FGSC 9596 / NRRL 45880 / 77-13-4) TaxID=660122 RepID=C7YVC5_FUSV7|nr:uncharacterized protein NECHADRAFT_85227 [Fusarium vanettenii 77-13-4]EEU44559.1 hypothetical protein NECHADRAFT_85227 [Fusarium vanettenii 77-13-4]
MISAFRCTIIWAFALMIVIGSLSEATPIASDGTSAYHSISARAAAPWQARHRMTSSAFQDTFGKLVHDKYRLTYVSGYTIDDDPRFAAIWDQNGSSDWAARHGMTGAEYQGQFNTLVGKGFRLRLVNGYTVAGDARYAAIWDKSAGPAWVARHGLSSSEYQSAFDAFSSQGYRLKHVSGCSQGNQASYAALWEKSTTNITWVAHHGMASSDYQGLSDKYVGQGFRLVHVNGYVVNNVDYYAAIWDKSPSGPWVARHRMSSAEYQNEFDNWVGQGYRLTLICMLLFGSKSSKVLDRFEVLRALF